MKIFEKDSGKTMIRAVRGIEALALAAGLAVSLGACGGGASGDAGPGSQGAVAVGGVPLEGDGTAVGTDGASGSGGEDGNGASARGSASGTGGLRLLCTGDGDGCHTQEGYYYIEKETKVLSDGSYGSHLMYMDFAALQEVYLCSDAGCGHDSPDCAAVLPYEEFEPYSTMLFPYQGKLYLFSKEQDQDGSMQSDFTLGEDGSQGSAEGTPSVLYRANLDGTDREKVYAFDASVTVEDYVLGDEDGLYLVTKRLTSEKDGTAVYTHSQERKMVFLDLAKGEASEVCAMDFGGNISWKIADCYDRNVVMQGIDYGRQISDQEMFAEDGYAELHKNSSQAFAVLNLDSGQMTERYRISNSQENSFQLAGKSLYCSLADEGLIKEIDLETGTERSVYSQPGAYYYLDAVMGEKLCCSDLSAGGGWDNTYCFIDRNTGEISHSGLVNKALGWCLEFKAVLDRDVLVVYDYEATPSGGGSYEITLYQHGLISQEDLFAGNDNFRKINMVGTGW